LQAAGGGGDPLLGMQMAIKIAMFAWPVMSQSDACLHCHHHLVRIRSLYRRMTAALAGMPAAPIEDG